MSKLTQHSNPQYQSLINETSLEFVSYLIEVPNVIQQYQTPQLDTVKQWCLLLGNTLLDLDVHGVPYRFIAVLTYLTATSTNQNHTAKHSIRLYKHFKKKSNTITPIIGRECLETIIDVLIKESNKVTTITQRNIGYC